MGRRTAAQGRGKRKPKAQRENDAGQGLGGPRTSATQANANAHLEKFVKVSPDDVDFDPEYVSLQKPSGNQSFTILSWNVLAQKFMHGHWRCPSFGVFRHAATRIPQIAAILDAADPDILCLQEVDGEIYTYLKYSQFFNRHQYQHRWVRKMNSLRAYHPKYPDGCLTAWRSSKFELVGEDIVTLNDLADPAHPLYRSGPMREICHNNVAHIVALKPTLDSPKQTPTTQPKPKQPDTTDPSPASVEAGIASIAFTPRPPPDTVIDNPPIVVSNTHIHWNPALEWLKVGQAEQVLNSMAGLANYWRTTRTLFCGDLNSVPGSRVYKSVSGIGLDSVYRNFRIHSPAAPVDDSEHAVLRETEFRFGHRGPDCWNEPAFTVLTPMFAATLDYVFHGRGLEPVEALALPSINRLRVLPNARFPSDHLPLGARVELKGV